MLSLANKTATFSHSTHSFLTMDYRITPPDDLIETTVSLPLSKSMSNRALIINALTPGSSPLDPASVAACDDTDVMVKALSQPSVSEVNVGAAGTAMRFLTAYFAAVDGCEVTIDGSDRMRRRPIRVLVDALKSCGADISYLAEEGFPPLRIKGRRLHGGEISLPASVSSQYISGLLMVAPTMDGGLTLTLEGDIISRPYLLMTLGMMRRQGVDASMEGNVISVPQGSAYSLPDSPIEIERDWSAASYWAEIVALSAGFITLPGLRLESLQGDCRLAQYFEMLGVNTAPSDETPDALEMSATPEQFSRIDLDLSEQPDIAQTIIVTCAVLGIPFHITGLSTLRIKETDRLSALANELLKFGVVVEIERDSEMIWEGRRMPVRTLPVIETYADHRMAMAFAPAAILLPDLIIRDVEVVTKSYPDFWRHLADAGFTLTPVSLVDKPEQ